MPKGFKILTRKELAEKYRDDDSVFCKETKNLNLPLCGFSSYEGNLHVGDVVGVCIQSNNSIYCPYSLIDESDALKPSVKLVSGMPQTKDLKIEFIYCEEKLYRFKPIYEQFFKIIRVVGDSYSVKPVYIKDGLILQKRQNDSFCINKKVNISHISNREFVVKNYFEKFEMEAIHYNIDLSDNYVSTYKIEFF